MKKHKKFIILYSVILFILMMCTLIGVIFNFSLDSSIKLVLLLSSCVCLYFSSYLISKYLNDNKLMKINLWIFFILYLLFLITLTLFDPLWGRNGLNLNYSKELIKTYLETSVNLIPFKTIINYTRNVFFSYISTTNLFYNLIGNVVCLMPFGLFLSLLFKKMSKTKYIIIILFITFGIELTQLLTLSGSFDIDDIILNTLGAFIAYKIINTKDINNLLKNVFLLEKII